MYSVCLKVIDSYSYIHTHSYTHTAHMHTHTLIHACTHIHTHTCMHTYTVISVVPRSKDEDVPCRGKTALTS